MLIRCSGSLWDGGVTRKRTILTTAGIGERKWTQKREEKHGELKEKVQATIVHLEKQIAALQGAEDKAVLKRWQKYNGYLRQMNYFAGSLQAVTSTDNTSFYPIRNTSRNLCKALKASSDTDRDAKSLRDHFVGIRTVAQYCARQPPPRKSTTQVESPPFCPR